MTEKLTVDAYDDVAGISGAALSLMVSDDLFRTEAAALLGLGSSGLKVLIFLNRHDVMTAGELAAATNVTSGTMTSTVDKLESLGLVNREQSDTDRRSVTVQITEHGQRTARWIVGHYRAALREALESIPHADKEAVTEYIHAASDLIRATAERLATLTPPD